MGLGHQGPPQGPLRPGAVGGDVLAGAEQGVAASPSAGASCSRRRSRGSSPTPASSTTTPPSRASPPWRSCSPSELGRYGVTVNAIAPAGAHPPDREHLRRPARPAEGEFDPRDPDNVAPWVVWLCTDAAAHITGQNFVVGGGTVQLVSSWRVE